MDPTSVASNPPDEAQLSALVARLGYPTTGVLASIAMGTQAHRDLLVAAVPNETLEVLEELGLLEADGFTRLGRQVCWRAAYEFGLGPAPTDWQLTMDLIEEYRQANPPMRRRRLLESARAWLARRSR